MKEVITDESITLFDNDKEAAIVTFVKKDKELIIEHTIVKEEYRGQGLAKFLMQKCEEIAKKEKLTIKPICSYAVKYFSKEI